MGISIPGKSISAGAGINSKTSAPMFSGTQREAMVIKASPERCRLSLFIKVYPTARNMKNCPIRNACLIYQEKSPHELISSTREEMATNRTPKPRTVTRMRSEKIPNQKAPQSKGSRGGAGGRGCLGGAGGMAGRAVAGAPATATAGRG